jgi:hypothetical protein
MIHLAQQVADAGLALDWKHLALALMIPAAGYVGTWLGKRAVAMVEDKLKAAGHPQALAAFDLLVEHFAQAATDAEKQALRQAAKDAGVDHPAISDATK